MLHYVQSILFTVTSPLLDVNILTGSVLLKLAEQSQELSCGASLQILKSSLIGLH